MPRPMTHVPPMRAFHVPRPMSHVPAMRAFHVPRPLSHVSPMRGGGGIFLHGHDGADGAAPSRTRFLRATTAARVWPPYQTVAMACFPTGKRLAGLEILAGLEGLEEIRPTVLLPTMPRPMTHVPPMRAFHVPRLMSHVPAMRAFHVPRPMSHVPAMRAFHVPRPMSHVPPMRGGGGIFLHGHDGADGAAPSHTRFPRHDGGGAIFHGHPRRPGSGRPTKRWRWHVFPRAKG
jgi:hypothetical protein